jgi:NAD-dependent SIR2 family protein deacetylase
VVYPAASIPEIVIEAGGELIIVNLGSTPLDNLARYHFQMGLDTFCEEILKLLSHKKIIPEN